MAETDKGSADAPGAEDETRREPASGAAASRDVPSLLRRAVAVPLFFFYLAYVQAGSLFFFILLLCGCVFSHGSFAAHLLKILGTRCAQTTASEPLLDDSERPTVYLCNHRSWGDFWVDAAILGGTSFVSRMMVAPAIPCSALWGHVQGWLWLFNRGGTREGGWVKWMAGFFQENHSRFPRKGLVLYPEGTRSRKPLGSPLKEGGLRSVYSLAWPVRAVVTTNKEHLMNEGEFWLGLGELLVTSISVTVDPKEFDSCDEFIAAVKAIWSNTWKDAYESAAKKDYVLRDSVLLPGADFRSGGCSSSRLIWARSVAAVLVSAAVAYRFF